MCIGQRDEEPHETEKQRLQKTEVIVYPRMGSNFMGFVKNAASVLSVSKVPFGRPWWNF